MTKQLYTFLATIMIVTSLISTPACVIDDSGELVEEGQQELGLPVSPGDPSQLCVEDCEWMYRYCLDLTATPWYWCYNDYMTCLSGCG